MFQVGVDCEQISRFRRLPYSGNGRFYRKIFTKPEIKYCISYKDPYPRFAVRFAAKEAAIKALNNIARPYYTDIEIRKGNKRQPTININKKTLKCISRILISVSLAHSKSHAIAFVIVTDNKNSAKQSKRALKKSINYLKKKIGK